VIKEGEWAMEDRIERELRRHQLALRMIAHRAGRRTICGFTGLTKQKIKTLRGEWNVRSKGCRRGPPPTSTAAAFFHSAHARSEASVIALFCKLYGLVPSEKIPRAPRVFPTLDRGERLCDVYEAFRTYFPQSQVTFEEIVLLAIELAEPNSLEIKSCISCPRVVVIDLQSVKNRSCSRCDENERRRRADAARAGGKVLSRKKVQKPKIPHQKEDTGYRKTQDKPEVEVRQADKLKEEGRQHTEHGDDRQGELHDGKQGDEEG
jgi:hypothetical protein